MWTPDTRAEHDRDDLAIPAITDAEWQVLAPMFPSPATTGRHRAWPMRELINAMFVLLPVASPGAHTGRASSRRCKRMIPLASGTTSRSRTAFT